MFLKVYGVCVWNIATSTDIFHNKNSNTYINHNAKLPKMQSNKTNNPMWPLTNFKKAPTYKILAKQIKKKTLILQIIHTKSKAP